MNNTDQRPTASELMEMTLIASGIDLMDSNFSETGKRFVKYLQEFMQPYNPEGLLKVFPIKKNAEHPMVVQSNIPFRAMCAHHLVPFIGRAHVGYIPNGHLVGLSKLARLVSAVSHKAPSLQEYIGEEVADELMTNLKPIGAMVVINAEHMCMACRGVAELNVMTTTSALRGQFADAVVRAEFFKLIDLASSHNV